MKTVKDLIEVLQSLPPETRLMHFTVYSNVGEDGLELHFEVLEGKPTLYTEYNTGWGEVNIAELWAKLHGIEPVYAFEIGQRVRWIASMSGRDYEGTGTIVERWGKWNRSSSEMVAHYAVKNEGDRIFPFPGTSWRDETDDPTIWRDFRSLTADSERKD